MMVPSVMMMVPTVMMVEARNHVNLGHEVMMVMASVMMMALMMVMVSPMMVTMLHLQWAINCGDWRCRNRRGLAG